MKLFSILFLTCFLVGCSNSGSSGDNFVTETVKVVDNTKSAKKEIYDWAHDRNAAFELYQKGRLPKYNSYTISELKEDYDGYIYSVNDNNEFGIFFAPNGLETKTSFQAEGL